MRKDSLKRRKFRIKLQLLANLVNSFAAFFHKRDSISSAGVSLTDLNSDHPVSIPWSSISVAIPHRSKLQRSSISVAFPSGGSPALFASDSSSEAPLLCPLLTRSPVGIGLYFSLSFLRSLAYHNGLRCRGPYLWAVEASSDAPLLSSLLSWCPVVRIGFWDNWYLRCGLTCHCRRRRAASAATARPAGAVVNPSAYPPKSTGVAVGVVAGVPFEPEPLVGTLWYELEDCTHISR